MQNTLVLGAVGAFDWSGGLMVYFTGSEPHKLTFLNESSDLSRTVDYSYLGKSEHDMCFYVLHLI